jgi:predicted metalloprotease
MRWRRSTQPDINVIDQRGAGRRVALPVGGAGGVLLLVLALLFGGRLFGGGGGGFDIDDVLGQLPSAPGAAPGESLSDAPDSQRELVDFVSFVFTDVQGVWDRQFRQAGGRAYRPARMVLFDDRVNTGCGAASSAVGPFYCGADQTVYLDLGFFRELAQRFRAPGDFAQAYVIAHEVGHHDQNLSGIMGQVGQLSQANPDQANELSVRLELQADCLAGVWAHTTYERGLLEEGDLQEGLTAAAAVGDDRIQAEATGQINPETWTHGSAEQRTTWFTRGYENGDPGACDSFSVNDL